MSGRGHKWEPFGFKSDTLSHSDTPCAALHVDNCAFTKQNILQSVIQSFLPLGLKSKQKVNIILNPFPNNVSLLKIYFEDFFFFFFLIFLLELRFQKFCRAANFLNVIYTHTKNEKKINFKCQGCYSK